MFVRNQELIPLVPRHFWEFSATRATERQYRCTQISVTSCTIQQTHVTYTDSIVFTKQSCKSTDSLATCIHFNADKSVKQIAKQILLCVSIPLHVSLDNLRSAKPFATNIYSSLERYRATPRGIFAVTHWNQSFASPGKM